MSAGAVTTNGSPPSRPATTHSSQNDHDWEQSFLDFKYSWNSVTEKFSMTRPRYDWLLQQEFLYTLRSSSPGEGLSDERLRKLQSIGLFAYDPSLMQPQEAQDGKNYKQTETLTTTQNRQDLSRDTPTLESFAWILPEGLEEHCCEHFNSAHGCRYGRNCRNIHIQHPWGDELCETIWSKCHELYEQKLSTKEKEKIAEQIVCLSAFSGGRRWYTARYAAHNQDATSDRSILLAEGGPNAFRSEQGLCWYLSEDDAKEAACRMLLMHVYTTAKGIQHRAMDCTVTSSFAKRMEKVRRLKICGQRDRKRQREESDSVSSYQTPAKRTPEAKCSGKERDNHGETESVRACRASDNISSNNESRKLEEAPTGAVEGSNFVETSSSATRTQPTLSAEEQVLADLRKRLENFAASSKPGDTLPMGQDLTGPQRLYVEDEAAKLGLGTYTRGSVFSLELVVTVKAPAIHRGSSSSDYRDDALQVNSEAQTMGYRHPAVTRPSSQQFSKSTRIENRQYNPLFAKYKIAPRPDFTANPIPMVNRKRRSLPMCTSFHVRGHCMSNCKSKDDHYAHSVREDEELLNWCRHTFR